MLKKSLIWGALPWESDGGAVVAYYQLRKMNYLDPTHQFYGIPKVPEQLDASALPFMQFMVPKYHRGLAVENKHLFKEIPEFMLQNQIPLLTLWHIPWEFFPIVNFVRDIGGKTLAWQTIHWTTDMIFKSKILNDVDMWVAPTRWGEEQLKIIGKISKDKVKYIPHSVDLKKFYPHDTQFRENLKLDSRQKIILVVGRCSLAKGLHQVIPVMRSIIKDYNAVFIIKAGIFDNVAKSTEIGYIISTLARNNPNIIWLNEWTKPDFVEELMASCDILLQPSGHEGFDVPLIEGMATKKAIAVTNIPNHYEIMGGKNRFCGIFMEPSVPAETVNDDQQIIKVPSSDMIEGTLRFLLENPEECLAYGEHGYARVRRNYNLDKVAKLWLELMNGMFPDEIVMEKKALA